ncbi:MAG: ABC transporter ATP-binding protein [Bacteroidota bacterium]
MLEIKDLSFKYQNRAPLFSGLNLKLEEGFIYGLLGKNGAGKSTLLKNMVGVAFPVKGSCLFYGQKVASRPVKVLEDIYFLPEQLYAPSLTPLQFASGTGCFYPKFSAEDYRRYLEMLDVERQEPMDSQSYGQQKKAMIAFGLAAGTSLLIMDEPTNGLDIPSKVKFRKLIASVQHEKRCIVISTHQARDLDSLIDMITVLHQGAIVVNKSMDDILLKLSFGTFTDTEGLPVLYEEENIRGRNAILENTNGRISKPDLELLFNAVISDDSPVLKILKDSDHE